MLKVSVEINEWNLQWLNKRLIFALLVIVAILVIRWISKNPRRRRWFKTPKGYLALFGIAALVPVLIVGATQGFIAFLPPDPGKPVDAIVVLGRGWQFMSERIETTAELWQAKRAPQIFASGKKDAPHMINLLEDKGIPRSVIDGENCSNTTEENAMFTAAILKPRGVRRILLVTDKTHMLRSVMIYRAYGFKVFPQISGGTPFYWNLKDKVLLKIREYGGIVSYGLRGLFFPQHLSDVNDPELKTLIEQAQQYGRRVSQVTNID